MIFVEARQSASVSQAVQGIVGVFISRGVSLVPIEEMAPLLKIKKKEADLIKGMWVRMKRGKHAGDLAQVEDVDQITSGVVGIKFIPRIDLTPREKRRERLASGKAGLGPVAKPPQRLFAYDEVRKIYGRGAVKPGPQGTYIFDNDEYYQGFCMKDVKINLIATEDVKPTLEEISRFTGDDTNTAEINLSAIADANKNITAAILFPGDKVEVYEGEQSGIIGVVVTVTPDVIAVKAEANDEGDQAIHGQIVEVPAKSVKKRFEIGEHVKVLSGRNVNASGMVVEVVKDVVTIMSDQGEQEVSL
jgi:transcription elongation factor SPT5